jgi:hypothetical protein
MIETLLHLLLFGAALAQPNQVCLTAKEKAHVATLTEHAIDEAYMKHVITLFDVWVRDPTDQPKRAKTGMEQALSAYHRARADILLWAPPICPELRN